YWCTPLWSSGSAAGGGAERCSRRVACPAPRPGAGAADLPPPPPVAAEHHHPGPLAGALGPADEPVEPPEHPLDPVDPPERRPGRVRVVPEARRARLGQEPVDLVAEARDPRAVCRDRDLLADVAEARGDALHP